MMPEVDDDSILDFFKKVWKDTEGYVYLATKDKSGTWKKFFFKWPDDPIGLNAWVLEQEAVGSDVYFGPALYKEPKDATKENILGSWVYWSEWDGQAPTWDLTEAQRAAGGPLKGIPGPSIRVQSSLTGHEHLYWISEEFQTNPDILERVNRTITYAGGADRGSWNSNRVLRPPYTTNRAQGKDREELPVQLLEVNDVVVSSKDFDVLPPPRKVAEEEVKMGDLPTLDQVKTQYFWPPDLLSIFDSKAAEGDRSSAMVRVAMMCAEQGFSEEAIYVVLLDIDERWGKYKNRADRDKHLVKMVERAKQKHPQALSEEYWDPKVETSSKDVYGFLDLLQEDIQIEWVVKGLMPKKGIGIIAAAPGVGKTLMSVDIGINMALGRQYLDWEIEEPVKILYLSLEMSEAPFQYFQTYVAKGLTKEDLQLLNTQFLIAPVGEMILLNERGDKYITHMLKTYQPDVVIVDSMSKMLIDMQDDREARLFMAKIKKYAEIHDTSFLFVHHNRKPSENRPASQSDMFGSVFIAADADFIISLWKAKDQADAIAFSLAKNRLGPTGIPMVAKRKEDLRYEFTGPAGKELTDPNGGTSLTI